MDNVLQMAPDDQKPIVHKKGKVAIFGCEWFQKYFPFFLISEDCVIPYT